MSLFKRKTRDPNPGLAATAEFPVSDGEVLGAAFSTPGLGEQLYDYYSVNRANRGEKPHPAAKLVYSKDTGRMEWYVPKRYGAESGFRPPERMPADVLNEMYGSIGLKFDRPMTPEAASILAEAKMEQLRRDDILGRSRGAWQFGLSLVGGIGAMATDPLEVATVFIPFVGPGSRAALIGKYGRVGGRVIAGAADATLANLATEPFYYGLTRSLQQDYTLTDSLINLGAGAVLGAGIGFVGGALARTDTAPRRRTGDGADGGPAPGVPPVRRSTDLGIDVDLAPGRIDVDAPLAARLTPTPTLARTVLAGLSNEERIAAFEVSVRQLARGRTVEIDGSIGRNVDDALAAGDDLVRGGTRAADDGLTPVRLLDDTDGVPSRSRGTAAGSIPTRTGGGSSRRTPTRKEIAQSSGRERVRLQRARRAQIRSRRNGERVVELTPDDVARHVGTGTVLPKGTQLSRSEDGSLTISDAELGASAGRIDGPDEVERIIEREGQPTRDYGTNPDASVQVRQPREDFDPRQPDDSLTEMLELLNQSGRLTRKDLEDLAESAAMIEDAAAAGRAARTGAACLLR